MSGDGQSAMQRPFGSPAGWSVAAVAAITSRRPSNVNYSYLQAHLIRFPAEVMMIDGNLKYARA